jgi:hypothetical protein
MSDEQQIRALIEAWAIAAHDGDLAHEHHSFSDTAGPDAAPSSNVVRS